MSLCRVTVLLIAAFIFVCPPIVSAGPEREVPQYSGTVNIITQHASLNALSFNQYNWVWKTNHDGPFLDHLIAGDLDFGSRGKGVNRFTAIDWIPPEQYRGELTTGATRSAPIYAWMWIDQKLKQELGC